MSNWFSILKIKTPDGEMMKVKSIEHFKQKLRTELRPVVLSEFRVSSDRATEASKINIKGYALPNGRRINASWRDRNSASLHDIDIKFRGSGNEKEPHELISISSRNLGPNLVLGTNFESEGTYDLILEVAERIEKFYADNTPKESLGVPTIEEDEERVSSEQYKRSLEEGNPGYRMIEGKLRNLADMKRLAKIKGINLNELLARNNLSMADFMANLPEEQPEPRQPEPTQPRVNERRQRMRRRRTQIQPKRGVRGPKREE